MTNTEYQVALTEHLSAAIAAFPPPTEDQQSGQIAAVVVVAVSLFADMHGLSPSFGPGIAMAVIEEMENHLDRKGIERQ